MSSPAESALPAEVVRQFNKLLDEVVSLYDSSAKLLIKESPEHIAAFDGNPVKVMRELGMRLVLRVVMEMASADRQVCRLDASLVKLLFEKLSKKPLPASKTSDAIRLLIHEHDAVSWQDILAPFDRIPLLREQTHVLEGLISRLANFVAKLDGKCTPREEAHLRHILSEFSRHLKPLPFDDHDDATGVKGAQSGPKDNKTLLANSPDAASDAVEETKGPAGKTKKEAKVATSLLAAAFSTLSAVGKAKAETQTGQAERKEEPPEKAPIRYDLNECLAELDALVGLNEVKTEVRQLANFLNVQKERAARGKPAVKLGLHTVFAGNPGTGKTTVARIVGRILNALGVLEKGHLVETERSGLVAEYAGQTGPKTHAKIDSALGGVLFIDEAYALLGNQSDDMYGAEAVQTLLKRMEDDREKLVVILAGYQQPMQKLLESNAGLSSRFPRTIRFANYAIHELGTIFEEFCTRHAYRLHADARIKLYWGFDAALRENTQHFGNAREARNLFEDALRRHADRIVSLPTASDDVLEILEPADICFRKLDEKFLPAWAKGARFQTVCAGCSKAAVVSADLLGQSTTCSACSANLIIRWPSLLTEGAQGLN